MEELLTLHTKDIAREYDIITLATILRYLEHYSFFFPFKIKAREDTNELRQLDHHMQTCRLRAIFYEGVPGICFS